MLKKLSEWLDESSQNASFVPFFRLEFKLYDDNLISLLGKFVMNDLKDLKR